MGYLVLPSFPSFSKAVFSLWFRIPSETFTILNAIPDFDIFDPAIGSDGMGLIYAPPLRKVIPLLSFGTTEHDIAARTVNPSFIGVDFNYGSESVFLACNLQTPVNGISIYRNPSDNAIIDDTGPGRPGCFYTGSFNSGASGSIITPDVWHHALVSFDITGSASIEFTSELDFVYHSSSTFSWAIDDLPRDKVSFGNAGNYDALADNQITTSWLFFVHSDIDEASWPGGFIGSGPFMLPCDGDLTDKVRKIEMGPLQVFTGVTCDASNVSVRRAFVGADRRPANPSLGAQLLGKAPAIRIDTSKDWINGRNRGTAGNFTATGTITKFFPSP